MILVVNTASDKKTETDFWCFSEQRFNGSLGVGDWLYSYKPLHVCTYWLTIIIKVMDISGTPSQMNPRHPQNKQNSRLRIRVKKALLILKAMSTVRVIWRSNTSHQLTSWLTQSQFMPHATLWLKRVGGNKVEWTRKEDGCRQSM